MIKFDLNPNEQIVLIVRKHWIAILGQVMVLVFAALAPLAIFVALPIFVPSFPGWGTAHLIYLATFLYSILLMVSWLTFFFAWTKYHLDIWVVTTHRIFIVEQQSMFNREISSLTLDKIQDLTIELEGFLSTMLKFGTILVETAGEHKNFEFTNARNPEAIKVAINSIQKDFYSRPLPVSSVLDSTPEASTAGAMGSPNAAQNVG